MDASNDTYNLTGNWVTGSGGVRDVVRAATQRAAARETVENQRREERQVVDGPQQPNDKKGSMYT